MIAATTDADTCRRMNLLWGVLPVLVDAAELQSPPTLARRLARSRELAAEGQSLLMITGFRDPPAASEPAMTVLTM